MSTVKRGRRRGGVARTRGVSPMIATILLVAITVVLAATLYVLATNLIHGSGTPLLGSAFSWGTPENASGTAPTGCASATLYCYSIEIAGAGNGVYDSNFQLNLRSVTGFTLAWSTDTISLVSPNPDRVIATYSVTTGSWTPAGSSTGAIGAGDTIVIQPATTTHVAGLNGDELVAVGVNGYAGTVPSNPFS